MQRFTIGDKDLREWADRKRAIESIEGSDGYKIILARITQERNDAEDKLLNTWRWNWFRILKLLIQRDCAQSLLNYIAGVKEMGTAAEGELFKRDPDFRKKDGRAVFVGS